MMEFNLYKTVEGLKHAEVFGSENTLQNYACVNCVNCVNHLLPTYKNTLLPPLSTKTCPPFGLVVDTFSNCVNCVNAKRPFSKPEQVKHSFTQNMAFSVVEFYTRLSLTLVCTAISRHTPVKTWSRMGERAYWRVRPTRHMLGGVSYV